MKLHLEFIVRKKTLWPGLIFFMLCLGLALNKTVEWRELDSSLHQLQISFQENQQALRSKPRAENRVQQAGQAEVEALAKRDLTISNALNYSWNQVLFPIEKKPTDEVALLFFTHHQSTRQTELTVRAKDVAAMIHFVKNLNQGEQEHQWYLASYQTEQQATSTLPIKGHILNLPVAKE